MSVNKLLHLLGTVILILLLPAHGWAAAVPGLTAGKAPTVSGSSAVADMRQVSADDVSALLDAAKRESTLIEASPNYAANAPQGATEDYLKQRRFTLREIVRSYERQLNNMTRLETLRSDLAKITQQNETWKEFDTPPPYSILFVDNLRRDQEHIDKRLKFLSGRVAMIDEFHEQMASLIRSGASALRLADEQAQHGNAELMSTTPLARDLARLRLRSQIAMFHSSVTSGEIAETELAIAKVEAELARRKLDVAQGNTEFSEQDYRKVKQELEVEAQNITTNLTKVQDLASDANRENDAAQLAHNEAFTHQAIDEAPNAKAALMSAKQAARNAQIRAATAEIILDTIRYQPLIISIKQQVWSFRYQLRQTVTPEMLAEARKQYQQGSRALSLFANSADRQLTLAGLETEKLQGSIAGTESSSERNALRPQLDALIEREQQLRRAAAYVASAQELINWLGDDLDARKEAQTTKENLHDATGTAKNLMLGVWNFELFVADDTIEVDGNKITGSTSVTLGKVLRAITIFAIGVFLSIWAGRIGEKVAVGHFGLDVAHARILRKWLFALGLIVLVILVLLWVHIPLSIFAFLGGTIAIGLGFGMQNLLKNLISGLMLLFERPFRPGDLIEVGNLKGNVREVGIRSSIIRDANGINTLIPNSTFLEQNVTNWMHENSRVRFSIIVGVPYDAPVKEVAQLLLECATRHSLVLDDPEPVALFEKFDTGSLKFGLYYWLEIGPKVLARHVASDLHFMIEKTLREHGIVISNP